MNLQVQIQQQQASVKMLEQLIGARRCSQDDLDQARRRLADLQGQTTFRPVVERPAPEPVEPTGRHIEGDEYVSVQAELGATADRLNRKMADYANKLHQVPSSVNCPELTKPILELKAEIEAIWDKKRYLERNRALPEEPVADDPVEPSLPTLEDAGRWQLAYEKRRLIDLRSKLKRKLLDPKAKPGKRQEWETELVRTTMAIQEIELKLC